MNLRLGLGQSASGGPCPEPKLIQVGSETASATPTAIMASKGLYYRPASYDKMKEVAQANRKWFTGPLCDPKEFNPEDHCSCPVCYELYCDWLLGRDTAQCAAYSEEFVSLVFDGSFINPGKV